MLAIFKNRDEETRHIKVEKLPSVGDKVNLPECEINKATTVPEIKGSVLDITWIPVPGIPNEIRPVVNIGPSTS